MIDLSSVSLALVSPQNAPEILIRMQRPLPVAQFRGRWRPELDHTYDISGVLPRFTAAYALASSSGDPDYSHFDRGRSRKMWKLFPPDMLEGPVREVFTDYGLFAFPLPLYRVAARNPRATKEPLLNPQDAFTFFGILASSWRDELAQRGQTNPVSLALSLHNADVDNGWREQAHASNPFRLSYRGQFLPLFIAYYNSYSHNG